jgi:hypothetical protein
MEIALEFLNGNPLPRASLLPPHRLMWRITKSGLLAPRMDFVVAIFLEDKLPWVVIDESLPSFSKTPKNSQPSG